MGMTVRLTDGRLTVTVEGVQMMRRMQDGEAVPLAAEAEGDPERCTEERTSPDPAIPPVAELPTGPDLLLIAQLVDDIKSRTAHGGTMRGLCERIQKELSK